MCEFEIGTLNVNVTRNEGKRAALFKLMELKHKDVLLVHTAPLTMRVTGRRVVMGRSS